MEEAVTGGLAERSKRGKGVSETMGITSDCIQEWNKRVRLKGCAINLTAKGK